MYIVHAGAPSLTNIWMLDFGGFRLKNLLKFIIDVKFASGIKNINFVFYHTPMCVSTVYSVLSPESCEKNITGMKLGWDSNP